MRIYWNTDLLNKNRTLSSLIPHRSWWIFRKCWGSCSSQARNRGWILPYKFWTTVKHSERQYCFIDKRTCRCQPESYLIHNCIRYFQCQTSDLQIVQKGNCINRVEEVEDIMADRGFNIRHLLLQKTATLNIFAFCHGRHLSSKATTVWGRYWRLGYMMKGPFHASKNLRFCRRSST